MKRKHFKFRTNHHAVKRFFTGWVALWFACTTVFGNPVLAQSMDFESPVIEYDSLDESVKWGGVEVFEAFVIDNDQIKQVRLFYRFAGEREFNELEMLPILNSQRYAAQIDTSLVAEPQSAIEYYIRAEDVSDNVVLEGFAFEPRVRLFTVAADTLAASETSPIKDLSTDKGVNWLYVALGALVVGGIAAAASGGGGGGGGGSNGGCNGDCTVTISIPTP